MTRSAAGEQPTPGTRESDGSQEEGQRSSGEATDESQEDSGGESTRTVIIAFLANLGVALAKSTVALLTGSASMMAEAAHSWADTGNQVFLFVADRKARKPPDASHPLGYGREAYVWSMFAAMGLFVAGGVLSVWEGIDKLRSGGGEDGGNLWAYVVLGVAFLLEGSSFFQAFKQTRSEAQEYDREIVEHALETSDPTLRAVFAEDSAALIGLVLAALGIFLHQVTGMVVFDALGSMLIGALLLSVAVVLIQRNRAFLTGQESDGKMRASALRRVKHLEGVDRVCYLRLEFMGPKQVLLVASIDVVGDKEEPVVARTLRRLERELEEDPQVVEAVLTLAAPEDTPL